MAAETVSVTVLPLLRLLQRQQLLQPCQQVDDHLAELFLSEEPIEPAELKAAIRRATLTNKFVPVFMGSAYKNKGKRPTPVLSLMAQCSHICQTWHSTAQHAAAILQGALNTCRSY